MAASFFVDFLQKRLTTTGCCAILSVTVIVTDRSSNELQKHGAEK